MCQYMKTSDGELSRAKKRLTFPDVLNLTLGFLRFEGVCLGLSLGRQSVRSQLHTLTNRKQLPYHYHFHI